MMQRKRAHRLHGDAPIDLTGSSCQSRIETELSVNFHLTDSAWLTVRLTISRLYP